MNIFCFLSEILSFLVISLGSVGFFVLKAMKTPGEAASKICLKKTEGTM